MTNEYGEELDRNGYAQSIVQNNQTDCFMCGIMGDLARHEIFYGVANRENSKRYGCWITLCPSCHSKIHKHEGEEGLRQYTQYMAMSHYKWPEDEFRKVFGKSYV